MSDVDISAEFLSEMEELQPELRSGWYRALCFKAERKTGKDPNKLTQYVQMSFHCLRDEEDADSVDKKAFFRDSVFTPFPHPDLPPAEDAEQEEDRKSKRRNLRDGMVRKLRALFGPEKVPYNPRKESGVYVYDGEEIGPEEVVAAKKDVIKRGVAVGLEFLSDPSMAIRTAPYVKLDTSKEFIEVTTMSNELPSGAVLLDPSEWWEAVEMDAPLRRDLEDAEEAPAKKKSSTKKKTK